VDKDLTVQPRGLDAYKQKTTADVFLPDDTNVNHELIKDGWCWWYRKCVPGDTTLDSHGRIGSIITDKLSFEKAECPLFQLSHERRNTGTNREVIEFILFHILIPIAFVLAKQLLNSFRNATAIY